MAPEWGFFIMIELLKIPLLKKDSIFGITLTMKTSENVHSCHTVMFHGIRDTGSFEYMHEFDFCNIVTFKKK